MLKIGFANKYFTLWNVLEEEKLKDVGGVYLPFKRISFQFINNLSMNEKKAFTKAVFLGVNDLSVDRKLRGKSSLYFDTRSNFTKAPSDISEFFESGSHKGTKISEVFDMDVQFQYFIESQNIHCKKMLIENFGFDEFEGQIVPGHFKHDFEALNFERNKVIKEKIAIGFSRSNLSSDGIARIEVNKQILYFQFIEFKKINFKGVEYGLPIQKSTGKVIKEKMVEISVKKYDSETCKFIVESFRIIKEEKIY